MIRFMGILCLFVVVGLGASGCVMSVTPPPMSFSKFARSENSGQARTASAPASAADRGKVGVSTGAAFLIDDDKEDSGGSPNLGVVLFPVEGAWTSWLADFYDLTASIHVNGQLGIEGNIRMLQRSKVSLCFIHGVNLGFFADDITEDDWTGYFTYGFSPGLFFQVRTTDRSTLFIGGKYTYASYAELNNDEDYRTFGHFGTGSVGALFHIGRLLVAPEIVVSFERQIVRPDEGSDLEPDTDNIIFILPGLTLAAAY